MSTELLTVLFFGSLVFFLFLGVSLAWVLGGISVIFLYFTWGGDAFYMIASRMWSTMNSFTLISVPLFILMAIILERSGVALSLYRMMHLWWGGVRGGLAIGTVFICAIFGAMVGVSGAAVVTMGAVALPAMLARGYNREMALGCINAGGGFGILIPPSIVMILYSMLTGVSVGALFAAGVMPGILLMVLVSAYIAIRCFINPSLGPSLPKEERGSWQEKIVALKGVLLPIMIVALVLGSILSGMATPTEAAAVGVLGSIISAAVHKQLTFKLISDASIKCLVLTSMIMWILFSAYAFSTVYTSMGAQRVITDIMVSIPGGEWGVVFAMLFIVFLLGMVMDPVGIMMITLPVFVPLIQANGIDPIWFGIMFIIMMEIGYMTPPFGFNLFYLKGVAPKEITMLHIYKSVTPYVLVIILGMALIAIYPEIATWLPKQVM